MIQETELQAVRLMIHQTQLKALLRRQYPAEWVLSLNRTLLAYQITTRRRVANFIAQMIAESGLDPTREENLSYTAERLMVVWPRRFPTLEAARPFAANPVALANRVYSNRLGNGNEASGDGWHFRGRGLIQLTGRSNYAEYGGLIDVDLETQPNLAVVPEHSFNVAGAYWQELGLNRLADNANVDGITLAINGSLRDAPRRQQWLRRAFRALEGST